MKPSLASKAMNTSAPPCLGASDVADAVSRQFDITGELLPLVSERDQNFRLQAADGRQFVVKISNVAEAAVATEFQVRLLLHLQRSHEVRTPDVLRTMTGELFGSIVANGATHALRVVSYVSGRPLAGLSIDTALAQAFGTQLALLGQALCGFSHPGESPVLMWDLQRVVALRELHALIDDAPARQRVQRAVDDFEERVAARLGALPTQVIHGDANPENVLVDPVSRRFAGFIDFGDALKAPRVFDVAIAASYLRMPEPDPLAVMGPFVGAYNAVTPLRQDELALFFDLVRARLATTITLLYWRLRARGKANEYRQKTLRLEGGAVDFLTALDGLGRTSFTGQIAGYL